VDESKTKKDIELKDIEPLRQSNNQGRISSKVEKEKDESANHSNKSNSRKGSVVKSNQVDEKKPIKAPEKEQNTQAKKNGERELSKQEIEKLSIEDRADYVIWCGDLNYRLDMDQKDA